MGSPGRNGAVYRRVSGQVIANGVRCGLCGKPLNKNLRAPHPYSTVCDHIVPISLGGDPLDPNNLQPAHKVCNERKGASLGLRVVRSGPIHSREW